MRGAPREEGVEFSRIDTLVAERVLGLRAEAEILTHSSRRA